MTAQSTLMAALQSENAVLRQRIIELEHPRPAVDTRFDAIFQSSPIGINIFRLADGRAVEANAAYLDLIGYPRDEVLGHTAADLNILVEPSERATWLQTLHTTGAVAGFEVRLRTKSGQIRHALFSMRAVDNHGEALAMAFCVDITARKQLEETLAFQASLLDQVHNAVIVVDLSNKILFWNRFAEELYQWTSAEAVGRDIVELLSPTELIDTVQQNFAALNRDGHWEGEFTVKRKDGRTLPAHITNTYLKDAQGTVTGLIGISVDVTERKQVEDAWRDSEANLRAVFNAARDSAFLMEPDGTVVVINGTGAERLGAQVSELQGRIIYDYLPPTVSARRRPLVEQVIATGQPIRFEDERLGRWLDNSIYPVTDESGRVVRLAIYGRDITEHKQLEEALREREENFRNLVENSPDGILIGAADGRHVYANPQAAQLLRYAPDEMLQTTQKDLADPAAYPMLQQRLQDRLAGRPVPTTYETRIRRKDGSSFPADITGTRTIWQGQVCDLVFIRDITERKRVEDAQRESERKLKTLFELLPVGVSVLDADNQITYLNPALERILDITHDGLRQGAYRQRTYLRSDGTRMPPGEFASVRATREQRAVYNVETGVVKEDGQVMWTNVSAVPVAFPDWRIVIATADITALKQAEAALREKDTQLRAILESTAEGILAVDNQGKVLQASQRFAELWRVPQSLLEHGDDQALLDFVLSQLTEPESFLKKVQLLYGSDAMDTDVLAFKDGRFFERSSAAMVMEGARLGRVWSFRDITARKQAEEALRESEDKFKHVFDHSAIGKSITRPSGEIQVNEAFCQMLGYSAPELQHKTWQEISHPADHDLTQREVDALLRGEKEEARFIKRYLHKNGSVVWANVATALRRDQAGNPLYFMTAVVDITERKQAEAALQAWANTLEQRVAERTAELQTANVHLTELDHLKDEFLSRISHELRTPLSGILISLELLEMAKPEKRERYMQRLKASADRLHVMIEDVLMFSQLNLYTRPDILEASDLNALIEGRVTVWRTLSEAHHLTLELDLAHDLPHVRIDGELFAHALTRLVTNAINYTPAGTVTISTARLSEGEQPWGTISVADTGPGIESDELPHIFERFYRGRAAADYKTPGTGIGLSVSREIIEKLGGRLTVETQVDVGSTFTVWLPTHESGAPSAGLA